MGPRSCDSLSMNTNTDLLSLLSYESDILDPHELEALAETAFDELAENEPEACFPYGRGWTAPMLGEVK